MAAKKLKKVTKPKQVAGPAKNSFTADDAMDWMMVGMMGILVCGLGGLVITFVYKYFRFLMGVC